MKASFRKAGERRYSVHVQRDRAPDLWCGSIGYDESLPHDLMHFFVEAEYGLDGAVFGNLAAGGNAGIFQPVDRTLIPKMWRKERIHRTHLPEGRRSEQLAWELDRCWRERTLPAELQRKLDALAKTWSELQVGASLTLEWPRPEGRKHPAREKRRPTAARRR